MRTHSNKTRLADIAEQAGVSVSAVSRFLNSTGPISEDKRRRIQEAITRLGYASKHARGISLARGTVAVLTGDILNPFFSEIVKGIQEESDSYGIVLTLYNLSDQPQRDQQLLQKLGRQRLEGIIVMGTAPFPKLLSWVAIRSIPMVVLNRRITQPGVRCILVDFENALYRATQHLLSFSHTRIGYIAGYSGSDIAQARWRGFDMALREAGLTMRPEWAPVIPAGAEIEGGYQAMLTLLNLPASDRPTGIIAFNDVVALGVLHALRVHGFAVPRDFSIIGVDDIFASAYACPPLTTISQPKHRMGRLAVQALHQMRRGENATGSGCTILESPLVVRESTGPVPIVASKPDGSDSTLAPGQRRDIH